MIDVYQYVKKPVATISKFNPEEFPLENGIAQFKWNGAIVTITVGDGSIAVSIDTKEEFWSMSRKIKTSEDTWALVLAETLETAHGLMLKSAINLLSAFKSSGHPHVIQ